MKKKLLNLIVLLLACLVFPTANLAQAPTLGTSANFVLFSTVGAVSNTGISQLTGNVGTNVGSSTGFGNVDGVMHDQDPASAQASVDLLIAYNQLNAVIPTFFPGVLLGNGQVLFAGVYAIPSPATLSLTLTLDAQGDSSAVFIFQIGGAFSTGANSKVKLINGAQACNVFWKTEGLVNMAAGSTMRGTIIANNAAIVMSAADSLEGRALSIAGAITVNGITARLPIGCGSPILTGPPNPILGTVECYALFSGIGPVTNSGVTTLTGDVGTNSGLTTGFNPLFVSGTIHPIPDGSTSQCGTDFTTVYNNLNALPYDIELLYPAQFGNNLELTPHTYLMNGAVTFTDSLILNAQGNANAVFIIKINGAFGTSTFSNVILKNGAQAKNVYWKIDGATDINDYSIFRGTIISQGAINLYTGVTLNGRALTGIGAINTSAINGSMPTSCAPTIVLGPTNQVACEGSSVSFSVNATGLGLIYQWRKGNVNLVNGGTISGATTSTLTLNPVSIADAANNYNVIVSGTYIPNDTSNLVSLTVTSVPLITSQPVNVTACVGDSIAFEVVASGTGNSYQWRRGLVNLIDGASISGATTAVLSIDSVTASNAGNDYNVVITGTCLPSVTSVNVSLVVSTAPLITSQPVNVTACVGDSITFEVVASGTGNSYQWRKGLVNLIDGASISGATTAVLSIDPITASNAGNDYNVLITGTCSPSVTSVNVSLVVSTAPLITSQPVNVTACVGDSITFEVVASGTGNSYQWRKGLVNLIDGASISGATTAVLSIDSITASNAGNDYNVLITGTCLPSVTSVNVSLVVSTAPLITSQLANVTACVGDSITFEVVASGTGNSYQWRKGLVNLIDGASISGATTAVLSIDPVNALNAGNDYSVVITGACSPSVTSVNVSLVVSTAPLITSQPVNVTACVGDSIAFEVIASGTGNSYQWRKGLVNLIDGASISGATTSVLSIDPISALAAGNDYNVVVTGACSPPVTSALVSITLTNCAVDLSITKTASNMTPFIQTSISFTITANYTGNLTATNVQVSEVLQSGYVFVSYSSLSGTYDYVTGIWTIGTMTSGSQATLTITVQVATTGNYENTVVISSDQAETDTLNNTATIELIPVDFFIPEGFSPNNDLVNDVFVIRGILNFPNNTFTVFNRWGIQIFKATPYQNNWDGKSASDFDIGGDKLPVGTYFYVLDLGDGSDLFKGTIYLNN